MEQLKPITVNKNFIITLLVLSILFSDFVYIMLLRTSGILFGGGDHLLRSYTEPGVIVFLIAFFGFFIYFVNKQLVGIIQYQNNPKAGELDRAQKNIVSLQRIVGITILIYPIINALVHFIYIAGYPSNIPDYVTPVIQIIQVMALFVSLVVPMLVLLPINLMIFGLLERMTVNIPLSNVYKPIPLNWKFGLIVLSSIIGIIILVTMSSSMILAANYGKVNSFEGLFDILLSRSLIIGIFTLMVGALNYLILRKSISIPVQEISKVSNQISDGNLKSEFNIVTRDEIGQLGASFVNIREKIIHLIVNVENRTEKIKNGDFSITQQVDQQKLGGSWDTLNLSIDKLSEVFLRPLIEFQIVTNKLAEGVIPAKISTDYLGEFNKVKESINNLIETTEQIVNKSTAVANGNLTVELNKRSEHDVMVEALTGMVNSIANVITQVTQAAVSVVNSSQELKSTSQSVSAGASEQAANAEEVSASIEQMAASISQNADNSKEAQTLANLVSEEIKDVVAAVEQTNEAMHNITEKIAIINEIAERTDLLAINAAIEAARAGESGRGFSVVATEIRDLAENSLKAAKLIEKTSRESMLKSETSKNKLYAIIPRILNTKNLVEEITAASIEQSTGTEQVNVAISQLSNVIQQNSAIAEEMASSADMLSEEARMLLKFMSYFKTTHSVSEEYQTYKIQQQIAELQALLQAKTGTAPITTNQNTVTGNFGTEKTNFKFNLFDSNDSKFQSFE